MINHIYKVLCLPWTPLISVILDMIFTIKALKNVHFLSSLWEIDPQLPTNHEPWQIKLWVSERMKHGLIYCGKFVLRQIIGTGTQWQVIWTYVLSSNDFPHPELFTTWSAELDAV